MVDTDTLHSYYKYVDAERYEELFSLFSGDIVYARPGTAPLDGMEEFRKFYLEERPIDEGGHTVDTIYVDDDTAIVQGHFDGILDGDTVSFEFADIHQFDDDGRITNRWTYTDRGTV